MPESPQKLETLHGREGEVPRAYGWGGLGPEFLCKKGSSASNDRRKGFEDLSMAALIILQLVGRFRERHPDPDAMQRMLTPLVSNKDELRDR